MIKFILAFALALSIPTAQAQITITCDKHKPSLVFLWLYDQKEDSFYATTYIRDVGQYDSVKDDSFGSLAFTLNEQSGDSVRALATFVRKKDGFKKTYNLTGEVKRPAGCPNAVGVVEWNNKEYQDLAQLPEKYKKALTEYQQKILRGG